MSGSFRIDERSSSSSWRRLRRSNSVLLGSELDSEPSNVAGYQRLSRSMREAGDSTPGGSPVKKRRLGNKWREKVRKIFSLRGISGRAKVAAPPPQVVEKNKRSSWLPDPDRRWPVQGW